jgi:hypothetical protein
MAQNMLRQREESEGGGKGSGDRRRRRPRPPVHPTSSSEDLLDAETQLDGGGAKAEAAARGAWGTLPAKIVAVIPRGLVLVVLVTVGTIALLSMLQAVWQTAGSHASRPSSRPEHNAPTPDAEVPRSNP